jgi:hypothetical protein
MPKGVAHLRERIGPRIRGRIRHRKSEAPTNSQGNGNGRACEEQEALLSVFSPAREFQGEAWADRSLGPQQKNSKESNLAWLCLEHHNLYDSRSSQAKGYTVQEAKYARKKLHDFVKIFEAAALKAGLPQTGLAKESRALFEKMAAEQVQMAAELEKVKQLANFTFVQSALG